MIVFALTAMISCNKKSGDELTIPFEKYQLDNGLDVVLHEDKSDPIVSVAIYYHVGSDREVPGRTGFAHLFEHIMFKATRDMPPEMLDRLTEDVGGFNNASTNDDFTNYYEVVPANVAQKVIAEAEQEEEE